MKIKQNILREFDEQKNQFQRFKIKIETIIRELLETKDITPHQIISRVKGRTSLDSKIDTKQGKYKLLNEITDLVGLRVITYLESEVDQIAKIIETEFSIDKENSIDKRKLKSDQFGYRSLHYVISLNSARLEITENKIFKNIKAEVQIRSILQHAWAEIEHDLGYKGRATIPEEHVRGFNRVAALLETADNEFDRLKKSLKEYEKTVDEYIDSEPEHVDLNQASIISFVRNNTVIAEALRIIKRNSNAVILADSSYEDIIGRFKQFFNIHSIKNLQDSINRDQEIFLPFVDLFTKEFDYSTMHESVAIFYYQHFLASKAEDIEELKKYFNSGEVQLNTSNNAIPRMLKVYELAKREASK